MAEQKILVTGGTGFIGGHLCERLAREGYSVRALVRDPRRSAELRQWGVEIAVGDLRDLKTLERAAEGVDIVYHIAALFRRQSATRQEMWDTNAEGTKNMLEAAMRAGVHRFVHCSTAGVHGDIKNPPANEDTPYSPIKDEQSKIEAERAVFRYMTERRLPVSLFRPSGAYGPRDLRFLKLFKAINRRLFVMVGSGETFCHLVYIDDLIEGILLCGTKQTAIGNAYILAGDEPVTLNQLANLVAEVLGVRPPRLRVPFAPVYLAGLVCAAICKPLGLQPPLSRRRVNFFRVSKAFDISKAKRELGFNPKIDLETGLRLTAHWYRENGYL